MKPAHRVSAIAGIAALGWAVALWTFGGVELEIGGLTLSSHNARRPFAIGLVLLGVHLWADRRLYPGRSRTAIGRWASDTPPVRRALGRARGRLSAVPPALVALVLAVGSLSVGLAFGSRSATGSDAYGYVSQASLWLDGDLHVSQPWVDEVPWPNAQWTFSPLGHRPAAEPGDGTLVPTYAPGLPLVMAFAASLGGAGAMFVVVPLTGALLVLATYGIGARLGLVVEGLWAAALVAASPVVVYQLLQPMTDVPVAAAWAGTFYFALGSRRSSRWRRWESGAAGLCAGLAVLIRPNLFFLLPLVAGWLVLDGLRGRAVRDTAIRAVLFVAPAAAGVAVVAAINAWLYGSPTTSGYGSLGDYFSVAHLLPNLELYATWLFETHWVPAFVGLAAVFLPFAAVWPTARARAFMVLAALVTAGLWVFYCAYLVFDTWAFLRFLLPSWPFMMLGTATVALGLYRTRRLAPGLAGVFMLLMAFDSQMAFTAARGMLDFGRSEARYPVVARAVRDVTPDGSVVLAMQHSGTLRYYGGRVTLRYDILEPGWLDRAVHWLGERGVAVYVLLDDWERPIFEERFRGQTTASDLDRRVRLVYDGSSHTMLFALTGGGGPGEPVTVEAPAGPMFFPPAEDRNPRLPFQGTQK